MRTSRVILRAAAVAAATAVTLTVLPSPANATDAVGVWWSGIERCPDAAPSLKAQVQYENTQYTTRATGYMVTYSHGYIRRVVLTQYLDGIKTGSRTVNYTGSASKATVTGIPTSYLPFMSNYSVPNRADVTSTWSDGVTCTIPIIVGAP